MFSGRSKAYESIIKGEPIRKLNIPESFNVLLRELNGLGLNIDLVNTKDGSSSVETREPRERKSKEAAPKKPSAKN